MTYTFPEYTASWNYPDVFTISFKGSGESFKRFVSTLEKDFNEKYLDDGVGVELEDHDCHASPMDGCDCQKFYGKD
jgi:hypothetical protein